MCRDHPSRSLAFLPIPVSPSVSCAHYARLGGVPAQCCCPALSCAPLFAFQRLDLLSLPHAHNTQHRLSTTPLLAFNCSSSPSLLPPCARQLRRRLPRYEEPYLRRAFDCRRRASNAHFHISSATSNDTSTMNRDYYPSSQPAPSPSSHAPSVYAPPAAAQPQMPFSDPFQSSRDPFLHGPGGGRRSSLGLSSRAWPQNQGTWEQ